MASSALPTQNRENLESFYSFELSLISEPPQEEIGLNYSTNSTALQANLMSARFDLSEDEIQRRLFELAEDNKLLKETLQQNNVRMRSELSSMAAWHNNITTNMAALQVTLQEAQARIQELEQEKEELMRRNKEDVGQVENSVVSDEDSKYEIIQKKSKIKILHNNQQESVISKLVNDNTLESREALIIIRTVTYLTEKLRRNDELLLNHAEEYEEKTNAMQAEHGRITAKLQEQIKSLEEKLRRKKEKAKAMQALCGQITAKLQEQIKSYEEKLQRNEVLLLNNAEEYQEKTNAMQAEHGQVTAKLQEQIKSLEEKLRRFSEEKVQSGKSKGFVVFDVCALTQEGYLQYLD